LLVSVRERLGMETAFVSEFVGDRRVFRYVDDERGTPPFAPGDSDPCEATGCQRVVQRRMPETYARVRS
jgi:hypothetical protein